MGHVTNSTYNTYHAVPTQHVATHDVPEQHATNTSLRGRRLSVPSPAAVVAGLGCYIHSGCLTGKARYSTDPNDSMGKGWYCTDGQYVDKNTKFDACEIHTGCDSGAAYWDSNQSVWKCSESTRSEHE